MVSLEKLKKSASNGKTSHVDDDEVEVPLELDSVRSTSSSSDGAEETEGDEALHAAEHGKSNHTHKHTAMTSSAKHQQKQRDFNDVCRFVVRFGCLAYEYGTVCWMVERNLEYLTDLLGYKGNFFVTPQQMIFVFFQKDDPQQQRVYHARVSPGNRADRLELLGQLESDVIADRISIEDALETMKMTIECKPKQWPQYAIALCYAGAGFGFSSLFQVAWIDAGFAALFSFGITHTVVWLDETFSPPMWMDKRFTEMWLPVIYSFLVGLSASLTKIGFPEINLLLVILGSIMIEIPGFTISLGVAELVHLQILSGSHNVIRGLLVLVKQAGGSWLGYALIEACTQIPNDPPGDDIQQVWLAVGVPILILSLSFYYKTPPRRLLGSYVVTSAAYGFSRLGEYAVNASFGTFFGSLCMGITANMIQRITNRPVTIYVAPATLVLVSGSIGFLGLASWVGGNKEDAREKMFEMFQTALLVILGMILGATVVPLKVSL